MNHELAPHHRQLLDQPTVPDADELMPLADGGKLLHVSRSTMYRLVNSGALEHYKIPGGRILVDRRQIRGLLQASVVPAATSCTDVA